jgi:hypothetical protein
MRELLIAAGGVGVVAAAAALWLESSRRIGRRCFAGLVALAVALSVFSFLAWAATGSLASHLCRLPGLLLLHSQSLSRCAYIENCRFCRAGPADLLAGG